MGTKEGEKGGRFVCDSRDIYVATSHADTQFSAKAQDALFAIEDYSWWFQYRAQVLTDTAERYFSRDVEILDIGGGNGYTTSRMQKAGFRTALLEPSYEACLHAKQRGIPHCFCGELNDFDEPIRQCMFLDVLEHIEDDETFLKALYGRMSAGGHSWLPCLHFRCSGAARMRWQDISGVTGYRCCRAFLRHVGFECCIARIFLVFCFSQSYL